ncbi:tyrosine-type recombinase/integrase [Amycolatopsis suaedae]|uniref:Site-specific integrase n=1 Tax=Amycolatopsis suaedae TaxID=2510978 RepID=A0A4Q7J0L2_9PSEU|nr:tyrosine-type recombinase/integrase [Amycolatopsis suaedae]RZQ60327.1 site-specific integrase [Amycolatopsis suaedae]
MTLDGPTPLAQANPERLLLMGRPPLSVGTYGNVSTRKLGRDRWQAYARYRAADGSLMPAKRRGKTKTEAENRLREALGELIDAVRDGEILPTTRMGVIAEAWFEEIEREADLGDRSPTTVRLYKSVLKNWILPSIERLQAREVRVATCDRVLKRTEDTASRSVAKTCRAALSGLCDFAVRNGAMTISPVRSLRRTRAPAAKDVAALTAEQRKDLLTQLEQLANRRAVDSKGRRLGARARIWAILPDLVRTMLATGIRLGELLALDAASFDRQRGTLAIDWRLVRVTGQGLRRLRLRMGNKAGILLKLPNWAIPMLTRLADAAGEDQPLFASAAGGWLDPSNVVHRIREAFDECGYEWVTSHVFRKTVATVLDEANLPTGAVADQLGNTRAVAEKHYIARRTANDENAAALETFEDVA